MPFKSRPCPRTLFRRKRPVQIAVLPRILQQDPTSRTGREKWGVGPAGRRRCHCCYFGWGTMRKYGLGDFQPLGYFCCASSFDTEGRMMTSPPCFQFAGVATLCLAVS